jgi:hypothetical protein
MSDALVHATNVCLNLDSISATSSNLVVAILLILLLLDDSGRDVDLKRLANRGRGTRNNRLSVVIVLFLLLLSLLLSQLAENSSNLRVQWDDLGILLGLGRASLLGSRLGDLVLGLRGLVATGDAQSALDLTEAGLSKIERELSENMIQ